MAATKLNPKIFLNVALWLFISITPSTSYGQYSGRYSHVDKRSSSQNSPVVFVFDYKPRHGDSQYSSSSGSRNYEYNKNDYSDTDLNVRHEKSASELSSILSSLFAQYSNGRSERNRLKYSSRNDFSQNRDSSNRYQGRNHRNHNTNNYNINKDTSNRNYAYNDLQNDLSPSFSRHQLIHHRNSGKTYHNDDRSGRYTNHINNDRRGPENEHDSYKYNDVNFRNSYESYRDENDNSYRLSNKMNQQQDRYSLHRDRMPYTSERDRFLHRNYRSNRNDRVHDRYNGLSYDYYNNDKIDRKREDGFRENRHRNDRQRDDRYKDDRNRVGRYRDNRNRVYRNRFDRYRDDTNRVDKYRDDRYSNDRNRVDKYRDDRYRDDRHRNERYRENRDYLNLDKNSKYRFQDDRNRHDSRYNRLDIENEGSPLVKTLLRIANDMRKKDSCEDDSTGDTCEEKAEKTTDDPCESNNDSCADTIENKNPSTRGAVEDHVSEMPPNCCK